VTVKGAFVLFALFVGTIALLVYLAAH